MPVRSRLLLLVPVAGLLACSGLDATSDGSPPLVGFQEPQSGATVTGQVTIRVQALDDDRVVSVKLFIDDNDPIEDPSPPYETQWNTSTLEDNSVHTLRAEARDPSGNLGQAQIQVTVLRPSPQ